MKLDAASAMRSRVNWTGCLLYRQIDWTISSKSRQSLAGRTAWSETAKPRRGSGGLALGGKIMRDGEVQPSKMNETAKIPWTIPPQGRTKSQEPNSKNEPDQIGLEFGSWNLGLPKGGRHLAEGQKGADVMHEIAPPPPTPPTRELAGRVKPPGKYAGFGSFEMMI